MNDPHVAALHYTITHSEAVVYDKVCPCSYDRPGFTIRVENGSAEVTMKTHHATVETACDEVEPFLRAWELKAGLQCGPGAIKFDYDRATFIDRNPSSGGAVAVTLAASGLFGVTTKVQAVLSKYPEPPPPGIARDAVVELMFRAYSLYRDNRMKLGEAANFCLSLLEEYPEKPPDARGAAAQRYAIAKTVLNKLSDLAAEKGGDDARKGRGVGKPFTPAEQQWLEAAMKQLIWRAAEVAGKPSAPLPQITMAHPHLPPLP